MKGQDSADRVKDDDLVVLDTRNFNEEETEETEETVRKKAKSPGYKSIDNLSRKQQKQRLEVILESVKEFAAKEEIWEDED